MRGVCSGTLSSTKPRLMTAARRTSSDTSLTAKCSSFWMAPACREMRVAENTSRNFHQASPVSAAAATAQQARLPEDNAGIARFINIPCCKVCISKAWHTIVGGAAVREADHEHGAVADDGILVSRHLLDQRLRAFLPVPSSLQP